MNSTIKTIRLGAAALALALAAGCSSSSEPAATDDSAGAEQSDAAGIRVVTAEAGAAIQSDPPSDLVILDVRTAEEFAEGHLEGAIVIDFYRDDFAEELAQLDPDVPYLLYCRSGSRSGQTTAIMEELGFTDVADIDGGILSWSQAGLPTVAE